jgi:hypothetical protein
MSHRLPSIWLALTMVGMGLPILAYSDCIGGSDGVACVKYVSKWRRANCEGNLQVQEFKFVCKSGIPHLQGAGFDIFCRSTDNKCNLSEHEMCPNVGLTQKNVDQHCTTEGQPNWNCALDPLAKQHGCGPN